MSMQLSTFQTYHRYTRPKITIDSAIYAMAIFLPSKLTQTFTILVFSFVYNLRFQFVRLIVCMGKPSRDFKSQEFNYYLRQLKTIIMSCFEEVFQVSFTKRFWLGKC